MVKQSCQGRDSAVRENLGITLGMGNKQAVRSEYSERSAKMVYVVSKEGKALMPTKKHGMVRQFLKNKLAKVVNRCPFTIQLTYESKRYTQKMTLGVDAGSKTIGISATREKEEIYAAKIELRGDMVDLIARRREQRRTRRNRKTRYRAARYENRRRGEGWVAPSIRQRIDTHMTVVEQIHKILPITEIIVEVAAFDIQKLKNREISGKEYQEGEQHEFWNVREYVLFRDGHICKGKAGCKEKILNVHHIESRKIGGDAPNNLITLCEKCHDDYHSGKLRLDLKRGKSFRDAAFMGIMRWAFYNRLSELYPNVSLTYGYITKNTRISNNLEKTHCVDARCITGNPTAVPLPYYFNQKAMRRHNRQLHKANILKGGVRKANQAPKYVHGFQLFDKVLYDRQECFVFGRRASGYFDLRALDGTKIHASASYKKLKLISKANTLLTERRTAIPPLP
jgi:N6-L-threonylcarbamoyladenine synthase